PIPGADRDAVLLIGIEPNLRWRTFSSLVVGLAEELGVELVITLGALLADVPHTRAAPVTGSASDPQLIEELGLEGSRDEVPSGDSIAAELTRYLREHDERTRGEGGEDDVARG